MTTSEMRATDGMTKKVANINDIRSKKSIELVAEGKTALDPYTFDYLLLCNKICGASHYNMQMKIVVDSPEDYQKWLTEKKKATIALAIKTAAEEAKIEEAKLNGTFVDTTAVKVDTLAVAQTEIK